MNMKMKRVQQAAKANGSHIGTVNSANQNYTDTVVVESNTAIDEFDNPVCKCGKPAALKVCWSPVNPGRRFFGCTNYVCNKVNFFS